jgi:hypothetical protein
MSLSTIPSRAHRSEARRRRGRRRSRARSTTMWATALRSSSVSTARTGDPRTTTYSVGMSSGTESIARVADATASSSASALRVTGLNGVAKPKVTQHAPSGTRRGTANIESRALDSWAIETAVARALSSLRCPARRTATAPMQEACEIAAAPFTGPLSPRSRIARRNCPAVGAAYSLSIFSSITSPDPRLAELPDRHRSAPLGPRAI